MKKYIPFIAIIFALAGIIFTYEWMFRGHVDSVQHQDCVTFSQCLVANPKLITWLIFLVIKSTSYFVLFPYLLYKVFTSIKLIWKKKNYIIHLIFILGIIFLLEYATYYGSTLFENLRDDSFPATLKSFGENQDLISTFWGIILGLLCAVIFLYPFKLNNEMEGYETKLSNAKDETERMAIMQQKIENISKLKKETDTYFYLLGFIVALSELSFAALREAGIVGHPPANFPIEVVYYHGLFQSLLIAIIYVPFSYYFKIKAQAIEYKPDDVFNKQLQLITDFKLNLGAFKKIVPVISPLLGAAIPALFNHIF